MKAYDDWIPAFAGMTGKQEKKVNNEAVLYVNYCLSFPRICIYS